MAELVIIDGGQVYAAVISTNFPSRYVPGYELSPDILIGKRIKDLIPNRYSVTAYPSHWSGISAFMPMQETRYLVLELEDV